jgi:hypothetical protein
MDAAFALGFSPGLPGHDYGANPDRERLKACSGNSCTPVRDCAWERNSILEWTGLGQLAKNRDSAHPMREDVKQKHFSTPLRETSIGTCIQAPSSS